MTNQENKLGPTLVRLGVAKSEARRSAIFDLDIDGHEFICVRPAVWRELMLAIEDVIRSGDGGKQ